MARISRTGKVARGTREVPQLTCGARKYSRTGRGPGKVEIGTSEVAWRTCGAGKTGKVARGTSEELAVQESNLARVSRPDKTRQGCTRHERGGSVNLRCRKVSSHGLAYPIRLQEARARWLGELKVQESKLAWTRQGCKRHERGDSAGLRCKKVNSHELADRARLQEARARWLGELKVHESKLAGVSRPGKVARGWCEVAQRTCGHGK
ncbi:hypothetical protein CDL15_Pgr002278 [Punica granatum]|uniref:Uncharacterized protein n=1 Tax=Punica granatum TaxID=22663 RepID=A0A218XHK0_PUNGR|nr:hypothetical protein CDL15_Pgr002278 [Punica granatum]